MGALPITEKAPVPGIPRVHRVNRPLRMGEVVLVPCLVTQPKTVDVFDHPRLAELLYKASPVLWPPHDDKADGQPDRHYHTDPRFTPDAGIRVYEQFYVEASFMAPIRLTTDYPIRWLPLRVVNTEFHSNRMATSIHLISNALRGMSCKALKDGRCPHKGFNMAQVDADPYGIKTCPMHGMRFRAESGAPVPLRTPKKDFTEEELWLRG